MRFNDEWLELIVFLLIIGVLTSMGATVFTEYVDKARLTLSVAAMENAQKSLLSYQKRNRAYPRSLDFGDCSDEDGHLVLNCDKVMGDIESIESYVGTEETFILKAKAKDSEQTLITVTESTISYQGKL